MILNIIDIEDEVLMVAIAIKLYEKQQHAIKRQCYTRQLSHVKFV